MMWLSPEGHSTSLGEGHSARNIKMAKDFFFFLFFFGESKVVEVIKVLRH